jgi:Ca2+-binding EF-hand superfamily protein
VLAMVTEKKILTEERLRTAFNMFDKDGNGKITKEDL